MQFNRCFGCMEEIQGYPCPNCGFDPAKENMPNYMLSYGTRLASHYVVGKMLGQGSFVITYNQKAFTNLKAIPRQLHSLPSDSH